MELTKLETILANSLCPRKHDGMSAATFLLFRITVHGMRSTARAESFARHKLELADKLITIEGVLKMSIRPRRTWVSLKNHSQVGPVALPRNERRGYVGISPNAKFSVRGCN